MKKQYLLAAICIFLWSTLATISKILLGSYSSFQVLCATMFFAFIALLTVNIFTGNIKTLKSYKAKDYLILSLIGLPGMFLYYVFYYTGTSLMGNASQAFIVNYLWPIMSVVFACILLGEKMTLRKIIAVAVSFFGVVISLAGELLHFEKTALIGAAFCALGAVSYGAFTALNQKFKYDKRIAMMIFCFVSFVFTLIINITSGAPFEPKPLEIIGFAWAGIFVTGTASTLWQIALESGNTAKVSNLAYITPFLSTVWSAIFLPDEHITVYSIVGLVIMILGIFIQLKDKKKELQ
ncbi:MAG: DMT family transporter [Clostridia bacterium]|nr:DMT family transporter [Clostridia bacterium]